MCPLIFRYRLIISFVFYFLVERSRGSELAYASRLIPFPVQSLASPFLYTIFLPFSPFLEVILVSLVLCTTKKHKKQNSVTKKHSTSSETQNQMKGT